MAKGDGGLGHLPQGGGLLPGEQDHGHDGHKNDQHGHHQEDIGDLAHDQGGGVHGPGHHDEAHPLPADGVRDHRGRQIPGVLIQVADGAGDGHRTAGHDLADEVLLKGPAHMAAVLHGMGADQDPAGGVADDDVGAGDPVEHIQIHQEAVLLHSAAGGIGRSQVRHGRRVGLQGFHGILRQIFLHQDLEGGADHHQGDQQYHRRRGKEAAEGRFHRTSNL